MSRSYGAPAPRGSAAWPGLLCLRTEDSGRFRSYDLVMRLPSAPLARDCLLAALLTAATQLALVLAAERVAGPLVVQHLAFAAMTGAVVLRRSAPLGATVVAAAGMALQTLAGDAPVVGGFLAMVIVVASLGYHASLRAGLIGLAAMMAANVLYDVLADDLVLADLVANSAIVAGAWGFARVTRLSTDKRVSAEVTRDRFAREAVLAERARIARDLHDSRRTRAHADDAARRRS